MAHNSNTHKGKSTQNIRLIRLILAGLGWAGLGWGRDCRLGWAELGSVGCIGLGRAGLG
jgi:hypothetical protein